MDINESSNLNQSRYSLKSDSQNVYDQWYSQKNLSMPVFKQQFGDTKTPVQKILKLNIKMENYLLQVENLRFKLNSLKGKVLMMKS